MTKRRNPTALIVAALAATILSYPELRSAAADGHRVVVEIRRFEFLPERPLVRPGDWVVWKNLDIVPHTVTARGGSWGSGAIEAGGQWEFVATDDIVQDYYCRFHPSMIAGLAIETE